MLGRLCDPCLADGDADPAVIEAERMLAIDTLREDSHRKLMEAYLRAGRRADAVRQYELCVGILRRELDVAPSAETIRAAERARGDQALVTVPERRLESGIHIPDGPPRIAVLPFDCLPGDAIPEHVRDGMVEDIICQLAGLRELNVISHGTTRAFRNSAVPLQEIGKRIDARYVLRGNVRVAGRAVRLTTELTELGTSRVVWARSHDTNTLLSFEDQDRIVGQIIHNLTPKVHKAEIIRVRGKRPDDLSLYKKVLLAHDCLNRLGGDNIATAKRIMDEVIAGEPNWGEAYAVAADCHGLLLAEGWSAERDHHLAAIERLSTKALSPDRANVRTLTFYAHRRTIFHQDFTSSMEMFNRALDAAPGSAAAWLWSGIIHSHYGDGPGAVERAERALQLSPEDRQAYWFYLALCMAY